MATISITTEWNSVVVTQDGVSREFTDDGELIDYLRAKLCPCIMTTTTKTGAPNGN